MNTQQTGFGGLQILAVLATLAVTSIAIMPDQQLPEDRSKFMIAEALDFAGESKRKIADSFVATSALPRTAEEAYAMKPTSMSKPEFVREVKFQHDHAGETIMIMVHLNPGVVENILGGEQYVYIAGIKSHQDDHLIEWQCSARNVDLALLPEECRS